MDFKEIVLKEFSICARPVVSSCKRESFALAHEKRRESDVCMTWRTLLCPVIYEL